MSSNSDFIGGHPPDGAGASRASWVDTDALLRQTRGYELAGSLQHAEAGYSALIVAAARAGARHPGPSAISVSRWSVPTPTSARPRTSRR